MAAGGSLQGKRYADLTSEERADWHERMEPGGYRRVQEPDGTWTWECMAPGGHGGNLANHDITEHDDGAITVSPSILIRGGRSMEVEHWHGFLEHGVWREV